MFLGPETSQETLKKPKSRPRDTQGPPKRHAKKWQKSITINASLVENALRWRSRSSIFLAPILEPSRASFLGSFFDKLLITCWKTLGNPFWNQIRPRRTKMSPREPLGAAKSQKTAFTKRWFSRGTVNIFSLLKLPKRASRSPRDSQETPKELQNHPKKISKIGTKN